MTKVCKRFANSSLENYICQTKEQKELVETLKKGIKEGFSKNIIIIGGVGTGKTHLAYSLLNTLAEKHKSAYYEHLEWYDDTKIMYSTLKEIVDYIRMSWTSDFEKAFVRKYETCPLLIIDEIGVQYGTESERIELYSIFNGRYENCLPIIAISNNSLTELQKILGQRIYDRLTDNSLIFELHGKSYRQNNAQL